MIIIMIIIIIIKYIYIAQDREETAKPFRGHRRGV